MKIFPVTITDDGRKVPLVKWKTESVDSANVEQIERWKSHFRDRIHYWGTPTGKEAGLLVLDVDIKDNGLETAKTLDIPKTMTQRTRSGGVHHFFKYPLDGNNYGNRTRFLKGLDIRGEGGYVVCYGMDQTPLSDAPEWFKTSALKITQEPSDSLTVRLEPSIAHGIMTSCLENIVEAPEGESNNILNEESFKVGQLVAAGSYTMEVAAQALLSAATERGKPLSESKATIKSGLEGGLGKPMTCPFGDETPVILVKIPPLPETEGRWTPKHFSRYDLTDMSKLRKPQLFKDWSTEDIHLTTADGGTGKTTLKIYEAIHLALGRDFLGFKCVQQGKTLFITGEDTKAKIGAMTGMILQQMGLMDGTPENNKLVEIILDSIVVKKDSDLCIVSKDKQHFIKPNYDALRKVLEAVSDIKPKMIVFDPIASFWGSEAALNDMAKAVSKFMANLVDNSGACVDMLNHMGKQSSNIKDMSQFAGRGGSALPSHSRVSRVLRPVFNDEYLELTGEILNDEQSCMICNVSKFTDGSPLFNKPFLIIRQGYLFSRKDIRDSVLKEEETKIEDTVKIVNFIEGERNAGKYPTEKATIAYFIATDKMSRQKIKTAIDHLLYFGVGNKKISMIENPDQSVGGKAFEMEIKK